MDWLTNLFLKPAFIEGPARLGFLIPLSLSVSIVYKTIRCRSVRSIPLASLWLCFLIVAVMLAIGIAFLLFYTLLA